ncbi:MAG: prepilin-type N-terminal cleavage/methylation domain-containing protein [Phycisphaerales bacterium]|nr:prepilin-type N-terminal cleavage/methylation domain-containing protein [Phycisphaerales bacterium]
MRAIERTEHANSRSRGADSRGGRSAGAFSLIELLVVVAVAGVLIAILLPALSAAREASRSSVCLSNLRQAFTACRVYADENRGKGPAIGWPYASLPNWALVVQSYSGRDGGTPGELYSNRSVLVCPSVDSVYPDPMQRTYAMNATGHAGMSYPGMRPDPDSYDDPLYRPLGGAGTEERPACISFDLVDRPSMLAVLVDSAWIPDTPPTRTASMIDFRQPGHVSIRLGRFHAGRERFDAVFFDGAARMYAEPGDGWGESLP